MKKIYAILGLITLSFSADAQRKIRLEVTIDTPVLNQNIVTGSKVYPVYTFKNVGKAAIDSLGAGESISFASPTSVVTGTSPLTFSSTRLTLGTALKIGESFKLNNLSVTGGYNVPFDSIKTLINAAGTTVMAKPFTANTQYNWYAIITSVGSIPANPSIDSVFGNEVLRLIWINKTSSIQETATQSRVETIKTYPNPATTQLSFEYNFVDGDQSAVARILDVTGRVVYENIYVNNSGNQKFDLDINNLNTGSYLLQFIVGDKTMTNKFNVQK